MDYKLDNENLDLNEKNKKLFSEIAKSDVIDQTDENIDTFKMYNDFMEEKEGLIDVINEMVNFSLLLTGQMEFLHPFKNISSINDLINFKNRIIMIVYINITI